MSVFDPKAFLGELGFSEAEVGEIAGKFTGERAEKLGKSVLRQSDYSRQMDTARQELDQQRAELAAKEQQLSAEAAEWAQLTAAEKAQSGTLRAQLEQTQAEALRHRQTLERMAQEAGVDPGQLLGTAPSPTPSPAAPAPAPVDTSKFASADAVQQLARMSLQLPAQIHMLATEHRRLTGQELDATALVGELERRAQTRGNTKPLDLRAIWEEQHNIAQVRLDAAAARLKTLEENAYARGRESALTEQHLPPGAVPSGKHAAIFTTRTSALQRPQPGQGLQGAINAFATGKYKTQQST